MTRRSAVTLSAALILGAAVPAPASSAPLREMRNTLGASVNLLGLQNNFECSWTWKLGRPSNPLLSGAHVAVGLNDSLSPAYNRLGGWVEVSPLSVVDLRVGWEPAVYFGTYASLLEFTGYDDEYDQDTRKARNPGSFAGMASRLYFAPTLKLKLGRLIAVGSAEIESWRAGGDTTFFYEPTRDVILRSAGDSLFASTALLLWEVPTENGGSWLFGPVHNRVDVPDAPGNRIDRIGAVVIRDLAERRFGVGHPTVILNVQYYITDRYKEGELTAVLAVRFGFGR